VRRKQIHLKTLSSLCLWQEFAPCRHLQRTAPVVCYGKGEILPVKSQFFLHSLITTYRASVSFGQRFQSPCCSQVFSISILALTSPWLNHRLVNDRAPISLAGKKENNCFNTSSESFCKWHSPTTVSSFVECCSWSLVVASSFRFLASWRARRFSSRCNLRSNFSCAVRGIFLWTWKACECWKTLRSDVREGMVNEERMVLCGPFFLWRLLRISCGGYVSVQCSQCILPYYNTFVDSAMIARQQVQSMAGSIRRSRVSFLLFTWRSIIARASHRNGARCSSCRLSISWQQKPPGCRGLLQHDFHLCHPDDQYCGWL